VPNHHKVSEILFELSPCALTHLHNMQSGMSAIMGQKCDHVRKQRVLYTAEKPNILLQTRCEHEVKQQYAKTASPSLDYSEQNT